ncbi:ATP-binding cassette domain-containing protein [[Clostridium] dakarense]|uniref:ATP-binding cassette domain-containing protein n=1 Tax=Faecalimicrobium dakarense TaxID=1301100 RepID=UPI0004B984E0|nr:ATP-binding cassette domain-containing protein [[Clostridium] dakarense]
MTISEVSDYVLRTNKLSKLYKGEYVVKNVSMNIKNGDIYGFIGKNGAGKTTLIRLVSGLANISNGSIEIFGDSTEKGIIDGRKRIGALIETPSFYPNMTAYENMELIRLQKGIPGKSCIKEKLNLVGLGDTGKKKVKDFSLGMKQRLGVAMAIIGDPEFLILDETTNGLDPIGIVEMRELLKKLNKENNITILISSHILNELYQLATCYGVINKGKLVEEIRQSDLDERCKKSLEINVDNVNKAVWTIENILKSENYTVLPGDTIKLYDFLDNSGYVSTSFAKEDIVIRQLSYKGDDLEDYFMNLVGGKEND